MAFGIYVHIPYCVQICSYCDFAKYDWQKILPPQQYTDLICREIQSRSPTLLNSTRQQLDTVYFGGGTPSLFDPSLILAILDQLAMSGFKLSKTCEVTIEINPATIDPKKLDAYLKIGVNRFSVGAQSFHDRLLQKVGRKHSAQDTVETLELLKSYGSNYSFDLLFALPSQTLAEVALDVERALEFSPSHLSAYYLTVPEEHPLNQGRALEDQQLEMFHVIEERLAQAGVLRYEISNFAREGFESKHNLLYWTDQEYWGLGVSAHSYFKDGLWGTRSWNPFRLNDYEKKIHSQRDAQADEHELLLKNQSLTDFCHTSLRLTRGLSENALRLKFGDTTWLQVKDRLLLLKASNWLENSGDAWCLSKTGRILANQVFEQLTFLIGELR
jgi:oxygen-independent coproporphyrinogen-3 oxidase